MDVSGEHSALRTYSMLSWFGAIGIGTSLYLAGQYFEYWLLSNDPADHPLVEEFIENPVQMFVERPVVMATKPVLSVILSTLLVARLSLQCFLFAAGQFWRCCLERSQAA